MTTSRVLLVLAALAVFAFTCGDRRPVVLNELGRPIHVRSTWEDGRSVVSELPPGGTLFLSDPPHHPAEVVVTLPSGESRTFTSANAPELIGRPVTGSMAGWKVTAAGIVPLSYDDLRSSHDDD